MYDCVFCKANPSSKGEDDALRQALVNSGSENFFYEFKVIFMQNLCF